MPNLIELNDLSLPELDPYLRLTGAQLRARRAPDTGVFIAESPKVIAAALDAGYAPLSLLMDRRHTLGPGRAIIDRCGEVPVYTGDEALLTQLTGYRLTRGVLCAMGRRPLPQAETLCRSARRVAVLEGIVDPTNVGAIFRAAAALGLDAVLLDPTCCDPLHRRAARVSMGTVFQVPWTRLADWPAGGLELLRRLGFQTAALALRADARSIEDPGLKTADRLAVVLGTEGDGLRDGTVADCDMTVRIPMAHGVDSLNVAAAAALAFWELRVRP